MKETKFATIEDLEIIKEFLKENPHDLRKEIQASYEEKAASVERILLNLSTNQGTNYYPKIVISKDGKRINGLIRMTIFKFINSYYLHGLKVSSKQNYYKLKNTVIEDLYNFIIDYAESIGYYSYYASAEYSTAERKTRIAFDQLEKLRRYDMYIIGHIDPNNTPYFSLLKYFSHLSEQKVLVRNFVLRNEFRNPVDLSVDIDEKLVKGGN